MLHASTYCYHYDNIPCAMPAVPGNAICCQCAVCYQVSHQDSRNLPARGIRLTNRRAEWENLQPMRGQDNRGQHRWFTLQISPGLGWDNKPLCREEGWGVSKSRPVTCVSASIQSLSRLVLLPTGLHFNKNFDKALETLVETETGDCVSHTLLLTAV